MFIRNDKEGRTLRTSPLRGWWYAATVAAVVLGVSGASGTGAEKVSPAACDEWASATIANVCASLAPIDNESSAQNEALTVVHKFGRRMAMVSLLAPREAVAKDVEELYAPLVTHELLTRWLEDPLNAPGRLTSSPWPDRIELTRYGAPDERTIAVCGDAIWMTSVDLVQGGTGIRQPVHLVLTLGEDATWRISEYGAAALTNG